MTQTQNMLFYYAGIHTDFLSLFQQNEIQNQTQTLIYVQTQIMQEYTLIFRHYLTKMRLRLRRLRLRLGLKLRFMFRFRLCRNTH